MVKIMARRQTNDDEQIFIPAVGGDGFDNFDGEAGEGEGVTTEAKRRTKATLEQMGGKDDVGQGYVTVFKMESGNESRCEKISADKYGYDDLLDYIKESYGPGDYRFRLYVKHARGNFVMAENRVETLKGAIRSPVVAQQGTDPAILTMLARQEETMAKITARMESSGQFDAAKMINTVAGLITAVAPLIPLFKGRQTSPMAEMKELLAITQGVRELQGPSVPEIATGATTMDLINTGMQTVAAMLAAPRGVPQPTHNPAALPAPSVTQVNGAPIQASPAQATGDDPDVSLFAMQADLMIQACQANPTADGAIQAANMAAMQIPDAAIPAVLETLEHPFFLRAMIRQRADLLDIVDWLGYMREELFAILDERNAPTEVGDVATDTGRPTGDSGDNGANVPADPSILN